MENYRLNIGELKKRYRSITLQMRVQGSSLTERAIWQEGLQDKQEALRFGKLIEHRYRRADIVLSRDCEKQLETVIRLAKAWRGGEGGCGFCFTAVPAQARQWQHPYLLPSLGCRFLKWIYPKYLTSISVRRRSI